ncbi:MAG: UDP-3-O-(3-hydroxymyristoyl)glucosamine N-acyltransferase [Alphaproteobacteria bacterium]
MTDPRFYSVAGPFTLNELADVAGAEIAEGGKRDAIFHNVAPLNAASADDVGFLDNKKYIGDFSSSKAGAVIVHPKNAKHAPAGMNLLLSDQPYHGYARIAQAFHPDRTAESQTAATARIHETAKIGEGCQIDDGAVIGAGAEIGNQCVIGANTVICEGVVIGDGCRIGPSVTLQCCLIGNAVIVHSGVCIGQDGFGFAMGPQGHLKVPQLGRVVIGDDVEIGANTTIDRGTGPDTEIGAGTKIDNLVQIGHNVKLGRGCIVVSQVGISGSCTFGDFVAVGGQTGFAGHLSIGDGAQIAAQSGVMRDIESASKVGGSPAKPFKEWMRGIAMIDKLVKTKGK